MERRKYSVRSQWIGCWEYSVIGRSACANKECIISILFDTGLIGRRLYQTEEDASSKRGESFISPQRVQATSGFRESHSPLSSVSIHPIPETHQTWHRHLGIVEAPGCTCFRNSFSPFIGILSLRRSIAEGLGWVRGRKAVNSSQGVSVVAGSQAELECNKRGWPY
jgi:hypothetical protein